jgi:hypothetical protein
MKSAPPSADLNGEFLKLFVITPGATPRDAS